jgi:hypothetical protein
MPISVAEELRWSMLVDRRGGGPLEPEDSFRWVVLAAAGAAAAATATAAVVADLECVVFAFALRQCSCFEP